MRFARISGLGEEQIDELERRVAHLLERPCWPWTGMKKRRVGKCKATGHGSLVITNLQGRVV